MMGLADVLSMIGTVILGAIGIVVITVLFVLLLAAFIVGLAIQIAIIPFALVSWILSLFVGMATMDWWTAIQVWFAEMIIFISSEYFKII